MKTKAEGGDSCERAQRNSDFRLRGYKENFVSNGNLTGLVQSIAVCPYPWHLLHLAMVLILKTFFLCFVSVILFGVLTFNIIPRWG